jgi:broad specificity phosphatase PhoE
MIEGIEKKYPAIFLLRNAQTISNNEEDKAESTIKGWKDVSLDESSKREAIRIANTFDAIPISRVYSSDLSRARDTAKEIMRVTGAGFMTMKGLRPWNLGDFQETSCFVASEMLKDYIKGYTFKSVKNGESFHIFKTRAIDAFNTILDEFEALKKNIVIVSHYRFIKIAQAWIAAGSVEYEIDTDVFMKDDIPSGKIFTITLDK